MSRFFILILLGFANCFYAQTLKNQTAPPPPIEEVVEIESEVDADEKWQSVDSLMNKNVKPSDEVYSKTFPPNFKNKYQGEDFNYDEIKKQQDLSFWEDLMEKIRRFLNSFLGDVNFSGDIGVLILKIFGVLIGALMLYFIIRFFFDKNRRSIFGKKNANLDIDVEELHENIHEINFPEMILNFESKKDYRSAVRYQFLYLLKKLNTNNLIVWNPEKTNRDYEIEIKKELKSQYSRWSFIFEYVWYGEFEINETEYQKFKNEFETAKF